MEEKSTYEQVAHIIDLLRPYLQGDGGDVELVDVVDGIVQVRLLGACVGCSSADATIRGIIEMSLVEEVPGVIGVEQVF